MLACQFQSPPAGGNRRFKLGHKNLRTGNRFSRCRHIIGSQGACRSRLNNDGIVARLTRNKNESGTRGHRIRYGHMRRINAVGGPGFQRDIAKRIAAKLGYETDISPSPCGSNRLVGTLAARPHGKALAQQRLAHDWQALGLEGQISNKDSENGDTRLGHEAAGGMTPFLKTKQP